MRYARINEMDVSNGKGVGVSLFVQGCPFHCKNCFNPETWDYDKGKEWTPDVERQFLELASRPYISRITILGGSPLCEQNVEDTYKLLHKIRIAVRGKKIWLYTGYTWEEIWESNCLIRQKTVELVDVLVDGKFIDSQKDLRLSFRGSSNQRLIDVSESLKRGYVVLL